MFTYPIGIFNKSISGGIPRNGLIGEWLFSGNANDTSGNGNNGTVNGAVLATDRHSSSNSAFSFNGTSNYIEVGDVLDMGLSDWTVSVWVNATTLTGIRGIVSKSAAANVFGRWALLLNTSDFTALATGSTVKIAADAAFTGWTHMLAIFDRDANLSLYINNSLVSFSDMSSIELDDLQSSFFLRFGSYNDAVGDPGNFFHGSIDDIRVYNRVLSGEERTALFNE